LSGRYFLTQKEVSKAVGAARQTVPNWERENTKNSKASIPDRRVATPKKGEEENQKTARLHAV